MMAGKRDDDNNEQSESFGDQSKWFGVAGAQPTVAGLCCVLVFGSIRPIETN